MNAYFPNCLLQHPSVRMTGKSSWTTPFLAGQLHPSFDFCLVRGSILFCTFRRNDTFVLRGEQDKCLDCIAKHVSFRSSHRLVDVISWLTHEGNVSTEISCFKKIVVHIQRTCCSWFGIIYTCRNIREDWVMQLFSFGTDFLAYTKEKYFSSNWRFFIYFQLEGCLARTGMRKGLRVGCFLLRHVHFVSPPSHWWGE